MEQNHIVAVYDDEDTLIEGLRSINNKSIKVKEVYTPYPVHEVFEILKMRSKFTWAAFLYGFLGAAGVLAFLYYTAVIDWPLNYGGKPFNTFPSFIIITLIFTILIVTIMSLLTFSVRAQIFPWKTERIIDIRATDDKFVVLIDKRLNPENDMAEIEALLRSTRATEVYEKEIKDIKQ